VSDFSRTKIQPPRARTGLIERTRLAGPLAAALAEMPLTLLCAPAGFGKTVALTQQLARLPAGTATAWVSVDADDDIGRFAACLVAALDPHDPPWRTSPEALMAELGQRPAARAAFAAELINALAATEVPRGLLIIDDLHRCNDDAVFDLLERLVERAPPQWGLVIATRVEPPLPLMRWLARGQLADWRQDQLSFTADEARALARAQGRDDGGLLFERTAGWAAGLALLLGTGPGVPADAGAATPATPTVRDRAMFDFLASEVLQQMPEGLRLFLLRCSVLPELTLARCTALAGPDARRWLDEVDRRGLFVTQLDQAESALRLHDLFRDFLEDRLRRDLPAEWAPLLHRAAAAETDPVRRIGHLARAEAWAEAEALLFEIGPALVAEGAVPQLLRLVEVFPAAWRDASPRLQHLLALGAWAHWDWNRMAMAIAAAAAGYERQGQTALLQRAQAIAAFRDALVAGDVRESAKLKGLDRLAAQPLETGTRTLVTMARSWHQLALSELDRVGASFADVVDLLEPDAPPTLWFQCMPPTAFLGLPGIRPALQRYVDGALARATPDAPTALRVQAQALQAGLDAFAGDIARARSRLAGAAADSRWLNSPPAASTYLHSLSALAHALAGDAAGALAEAQALIDELDDERSSGRRAIWLGHYLHMRLRVAAIVDDVDAELDMHEQLRRATHAAEQPAFRRQRGAVPARLAAIEGRWRDAAAGFGLALADEVALDHYGQAGELRMRWAVALVHCGRLDEAAQALRPAFARVAADGDIAPLLMAGRSALATLAGAAWAGRLPTPDLLWLQA
jgi:LuxR family transcriptional regulator, maltose regulon positive regulatory protein